MTIWSSIFKGAHKGGPAGTAVVSSGDEWLRRAEDDPRDPVARQHAGEELAHRSDGAGAIRHWLAAADIYMSQGLAVKALALLVDVLHLDPDNDEVTHRIANIARDEQLPVERGADMTIRTRLRAWTPLFSDFSREDLTEIVRQMTIRRFEAAEILLQEGEVAAELSVIMEGTVRIVTKNTSGEEVEIGRLHHGDFFGESSLLRDLPTPATLVAESTGELLVWPRAAYDTICVARPGLRSILERFHEERAGRAVDAVVARFHKKD